ncbi:sialic acid-binding Ig-like lectin 14 [Astyanax mexicanus]|uniref:sialic acid-binding Ig-like lectin 14 n=1 Tax=Astyanax mexicanus TaxID=7994 RepID=UPI0020CAEAE5|nr:sialic acid-binding Ig-like lectin 14 [Astyanax mexicanus]
MSSHGRVLFRWICLQVIFASVLSEDWEANVVPEIKALTTSCVVLPCTFKYPGAQLPDSRLRAIWHTKEKQDQIIYHEDRTRVIDNFKDRTTLLGRLSEKNCTLEIDKVRNHDNGPFCFRAEIPQKDQYSFLKSCVTVKPTDEPENLQLDKKEFLEEGEPVSFRCSVKHTCPSHPPTITWSYPNSNPTVNHRDISNGNWEAESLLTLIPKEKDAHTFLTCTIKFHGGQTRTITTRLYVKRKENYLHIIIPVAAALGTALLFGVMCFFMSKKYKSQIQELQSGNGFLGRMSRMSQRFRSVD